MKKTILLSSIAFAAFCIFVAFLFFNGLLQFNNPSYADYPVRGVDVSSYQGNIDFDVLEKQNIKFAFIKATEGSGYVDPYFDVNFKNAIKTELRIGAYHFFSYDSSGSTQADNFISAVPKTENMLPPVVDVEFYGDKEKNLPDKESAQREILALLLKLKAHYGVNPIIYATEKSYRLYIAGAFDDYDIWIRNVMMNPTLSDGRKWLFWQYSNRMLLNGYKGKEKYIDMNLFNGTSDEFRCYPNYRS
jgi:lysozyme